jgi:predicted transcriptional regulator of viral defense system
MASLAPLIKSGKTIFKTKELSEIWNTKETSTKTITLRKVKQGDLIKIKRGIFALTTKYNKLELACKMMQGSYISLFTVLKNEGVIFQEFNTIYLVAPRAKNIQIEKTNYEYHSIKNLNFIAEGISFNATYSIAKLERAILDLFFLFDTDFSDFNINQFDKELFLKLAKLYNKKVQTKADKFIKFFKL